MSNNIKEQIVDWDFLIENKNDSTLFWSDEHGWVDKKSASVYTEEEALTLTLPVEGQWVLVWPGLS
jgi:hypothetical protein